MTDEAMAGLVWSISDLIERDRMLYLFV